MRVCACISYCESACEVVDGDPTERSLFGAVQDARLEGRVREGEQRRVERVAN